jgi:hypothetical protein
MFLLSPAKEQRDVNKGKKLKPAFFEHIFFAHFAALQ